MAAMIRIHKHRKTDQEPEYRLSVLQGPSKLDGMGIPKQAARKVEMMDRLRRLGATDDQIDRAFRDFGLGGHLKTGHRWTPENRPTERGTRTTLFITWDRASGQTFL
jgi:hypothetical protein